MNAKEFMETNERDRRGPRTEPQVDSIAGSVLNGLFDNMVTYRRERYVDGKITDFMDGRMIDDNRIKCELTPSWRKKFGHYQEPNRGDTWKESMYDND